MENQRQLAAIMFTDIVGYTAMMGKDEQLAVKSVSRHNLIIEQCVPKYKGDIINFFGDGCLSIYPSATAALECAMEIQMELQKDLPVPLRIGIHTGEILIKEGNVFGDGVNIASRIESLGQAGTIMFSQDVFHKIRNNNTFIAKSLGTFEFKNVEQPMEIFALANEGFPVPKRETISGKLKLQPDQQEAKLGESATNSIKKDKKPKPAEKSIAVLPFVNMSSDTEQEYFCEGISEEIINTIVQLPDLTVAGRTSSFCFKGKNEDLRKVGDTLGVSKILEGSVRKSGNRVRITAQLIEASNGFHLWSKKYDRELDDVFKVQDEISAEIAKQLKITFAGTQQKPKPRQQTKNIEAYQQYYKGRSLFYQRGTSLFEAINCFKAALEIDPGYALAHSGLADTYVMLSFHGYLSPTECWAEALPAAQKALKFGPDLGEIYNTLALISLLHDRDLKASGLNFEKALKLNPTNTQARVWYGMIYLGFMQGRFEEGYEQFRLALEHDPLSSYAISCFALTLNTGGKIKEAIPFAEKAVKLDPGSFIARYNLGYCYLHDGQFAKALEHCLIALKISSRHAWALHLTLITYLKMENNDEALKIYMEMKDRYRDHYLPPSNLAIAAAALGKDKYALELVQEAMDTIDPYLSFIITLLKDSEALRQIPGFKKMIKLLGYKGIKL